MPMRSSRASDAGLAAQRRLLARLRDRRRARGARRAGNARSRAPTTSCLLVRRCDRSRAPRRHGAVARTNRRMLECLQPIVVMPGMVVHNCAPHPRTGRPTAAIHALGDPDGKRCSRSRSGSTGTTYRVWDHARLPMRPSMPVRARRGQHARDRGGAARHETCLTMPRRSCPSTTACSRSSTCDRGLGSIASVRASPRSCTAFAGARRSTGRVRPVVLERGRTAFIPAAGAAGPSRPTGPTPRSCSRACTSRRRGSQRAPARSRACAGPSPNRTGPREIIVIANGGDGQLVGDRFADLASELFRADGDVAITVHEEVERRGQLLGLLDAMAVWSAARRSERGATRRRARHHAARPGHAAQPDHPSSARHQALRADAGALARGRPVARCRLRIAVLVGRRRARARAHGLLRRGVEVGRRAAVRGARSLRRSSSI